MTQKTKALDISFPDEPISQPSIIPDKESEGSDFVLVGRSAWVKAGAMAVYIGYIDGICTVEICADDDEEITLDTAQSSDDEADEAVAASLKEDEP